MPTFDPSFSDISPSSTSTPDISQWFSGEVRGAPDILAPYLAAHGYKPFQWQPYLVDGEFAGFLVNMERVTFNHGAAIQDLLTRMTAAYNEGRQSNDTRYEDLIRNLDDLLDKAQQHMDSAKTDLDAQIVLHMARLDTLEDEYDDFFTDIQTDLDGLTVSLDADRTRVNNQFDALVTASQQDLANRGFYSSGLISGIESGIEERRALALTEITEREQRLIADITLKKNGIYVDVLKMRSGLIGAKMELTNRQQQFLAYQLDTKNNLALAMFGFVERREDSYPGLGDMAAAVTSLGDHR